MNSNNIIDNPILNSNLLCLNEEKVPLLVYFNPFLIPVKKMPVRIVIEDDSIKTNVKTENNHEEAQDSEIMSKFSKEATSETNVNVKLQTPTMWQDESLMNAVKLEYSKFFYQECTPKYKFSITRSRKKEKKFIHKKINKIISRVHNMDCLLKKIKAKYLKFLFLNLKKELQNINIDIRKFDQCREVRNLNVPHNRDNFINLTILQVLMNNQVIDFNDLKVINNSNNENLRILLNKKIKYHFQFDFMSSKYFKNWLKDPIKIYDKVRKIKFIQNREKLLEKLNKNCLKFPNHSKNIFQSNQENYEIYKKLLLQTTNNFIFYFQNNPLKFGKKQRYD